MRAPTVSTLTVLYDARCRLCRGARDFLAKEPKYVDMTFIAAGTETARQRFPGLDHAATLSELTVIGDDGSVYTGDRAFLICLWGLRGYRDWSLRLARPDWLPHARRFFLWFSENRGRIDQLLPGAP